jgi:hypothetical protein
MKTKTLLTSVFLTVFAFALQAQEAKIVRVIGAEAVTVYPADSDEALMLGQGDVIPVGALVEVPAAAKLFMKTFEGTITTAQGGSVFMVEAVEVTAAGKEKTLVDLKSGDLVAVLDPNKRDVNDYGVRTPKGVAAARGTNFTVTVGGQNVTMSVNGGAVEFQLPGGGSIDFSSGTVLLPGNNTPVPLSQAISNPVVSQAVQAASNALAQIAADPQGTGLPTATATTALNNVITTVGQTGDNTATAQVTAAAAQANPDLAADLVKTATAANPDAAAEIVATTAEATGGDADNPSQDLLDAANDGIDDANEGSDSDDTAPITDTDVEDAVEIDVPNDNVPVSPSS